MVLLIIGFFLIVIGFFNLFAPNIFGHWFGGTLGTVRRSLSPGAYRKYIRGLGVWFILIGATSVYISASSHLLMAKVNNVLAQDTYEYEATAELSKFPKALQTDPLVIWLMQKSMPGFIKRHPEEPPKISKLYALALFTCSVSDLPTQLKNQVEKELAAGSVIIGKIPKNEQAIMQAEKHCHADMVALAQLYKLHLRWANSTSSSLAGLEYSAMMELKKYPSNLQSDPLTLWCDRQSMPTMKYIFASAPKRTIQLLALASCTCMVGDLPPHKRTEKELASMKAALKQRCSQDFRLRGSQYR